LIPDRRISGWFPVLEEKAAGDEDIDSVAIGSSGLGLKNELTT
jgi:hypothetical protein